MMSYLSIVEKFKILFDMILDFKFIFIFLGVLVIATFLYLIKKIDNRKYIMIITLSLLLILGIDIVINYKELAEVFDNFMTIFFSNIYFPSVYVYVGTLLIVAIAFITSMFNKMLNKIYKIINGITFVMNNILLAIILNIIAKNKIDVFTPNELYTNINLVAVLEISIGLFGLWVLSLIVVYTTSVICDRIGNKRREVVTCDTNSDVEEIDITKDTSSYNNVLTPVDAVSEVKEPSIVTYEIESNNVEPEVIEEVSNVDTNVGTDDVKENNSNVVTFDDILNGRIPVNYYENVLSVDAHDIVNPQEVFENKYKEYKEKSNIESFQDIVNDANEDKVVIIKNNRAKDNLKINTVTLDSLEDKNDIVDTMVISESSCNENISEVTNELDNTGKIDVVTYNEEIKKDSYSLDDYKKFIAMLGELKDFTNSNNVSIDDAVTISLINNYSIDDCLKFKEILESNLN
ncbi:unknown [Firmicutes bacterium CAG:321]|nr:unknown [Firmicutes bacterium CAG:321]